MTEVYFREADSPVEKVSLQSDETVLSGLLRSGVDIPYGCRTGVCQSCMMKCQDSEIPAEAQKGLSEAQKQQGYFLSCCAKPRSPMIVGLSNLFKKETTTVVEKSVLSAEIVRVRVKKVICYRPGQYMTLWKDQDTARTYSLASHPTHDDFIEFHVRVYSQGVFSPWSRDTLEVGDKLDIQGPMGNCFYTADNKDQTLFLSGIGTGLAPLYGIARDALLSGHSGQIILLIGSRTEQGIYYQDELKHLQEKYANFQVKYSVADLDSETMASQGHASDIYTYANILMPDMTNVRVFLCGAESFVKKMRKQSFLAGANMGDISSDTFLCFPK
ncbi:MAG: 2Fe-2S iron-sulfur cluster binding domain-containing protein [Acidiferrobacterales bacterium]|nr:2Fe-2S iron-sulfur cluster binding domain-containing protein [Acidiferrobacterales bacterium]